MAIKQIIVMRKDLKMRRGKEIAQGCHACMKVFMELSKPFYYVPYVHTNKKKIYTFEYDENGAWDQWLNGIFTKICVTVNSEQELIDVYNKALEAKIPAAIIEDNGLTEFKGIKTKTCCAIGPASDEDLKPITGHLPLY